MTPTTSAADHDAHDGPAHDDADDVPPTMTPTTAPPAPPPAPPQREVLNSGEQGSPGEQMVSPNRQYRLIMQSDGNLVIYDAANTPLWNTGTEGSSGTVFRVNPDGNPVVVRPGNIPVCTFDINGRGHAVRVVLQNDSNLVVVDDVGVVLWDRFTKRCRRL